MLTRPKRLDEALGELRSATELEPERARYACGYAVGLHLDGHPIRQIIVLKELLIRHPADRGALSAIVSFAREAGDLRTALEYADRLASVVPDDPTLVAFIDDTQGQLKKLDGR